MNPSAKSFTFKSDKWLSLISSLDLRSSLLPLAEKKRSRRAKNSDAALHSMVNEDGPATGGGARIYISPAISHQIAAGELNVIFCGCGKEEAWKGFAQSDRGCLCRGVRLAGW